MNANMYLESAFEMRRWDLFSVFPVHKPNDDDTFAKTDDFFEVIATFFLLVVDEKCLRVHVEFY